MFGGLTHAPAVELARTLVEITPAGLEHVFFADSGSVSVEVAIKMCLQYQRSRGPSGQAPADDVARRLPRRHVRRDERVRPRRRDARAVARRAAAAGVRDARRRRRSSPPTSTELAELVEEHADELAAVIVEPVVQGAGGMRFHDPRYLHVLRELTLTHDVLLVFDEIATGFGRTGELFAADHARVAPDVMCVGKALTGGYLTMAATLCTPAVARGISDGEAGVLMHGPTFMANPLAAAVAAGVGGAAARRGTGGAEVRGIEAALRAGWRPRGRSPGVRDVRVLGGIGVVQLDDPVDMAAATEAAVDAGVWLRPFRDLVYTMPPYVCTPDDLATITAGVVRRGGRRPLTATSPRIACR